VLYDLLGVFIPNENKPILPSIFNPQELRTEMRYTELSIANSTTVIIEMMTDPPIPVLGLVVH